MNLTQEEKYKLICLCECQISRMEGYLTKKDSDHDLLNKEIMILSEIINKLKD